MDKTEFVRMMSKKSNVVMGQCEKMFDIFCETLHDAIMKREKINLGGVVMIAPREIKARKLNHPLTGEPISVAETRSIRATLSARTRRELNGRDGYA